MHRTRIAPGACGGPRRRGREARQAAGGARAVLPLHLPVELREPPPPRRESAARTDTGTYRGTPSFRRMHVERKTPFRYVPGSVDDPSRNLLQVTKPIVGDTSKGDCAQEYLGETQPTRPATLAQPTSRHEQHRSIRFQVADLLAQFGRIGDQTVVVYLRSN